MSKLEQIGEEIWLAEGDIVNFHGFPYPTRSVIVRLPERELWIWSPIQLSPDLKQEVEALGEPRHLVSPNAIHHLFLAKWHRAFPDTLLWGPQTTIAKRPELTFQAPLDNRPPVAWEETIDQVWFNSSFVLDEVVFFHRPSRTAILADLSENFSESFLQEHWSWWQRQLARPWGIVEGKGYAPLEWRLSFLKRKAARQSRDAILAWNPEQVIMAHGEWQRSDGRCYLERAFSWLG